MSVTSPVGDPLAVAVGRNTASALGPQAAIARDRGAAAADRAGALRRSPSNGGASFADALAGGRRHRPLLRPRPLAQRERGRQAPAPGQYDALVSAAAQRYGLDPALLHGLIQQESGFDPNAGSPAGAQGLCQLMPGTAASLGVTNPLDPAQSIDGGARYLRASSTRSAATVARARRLQRRPGRGAAIRRRAAVRRDAGLRPEGPRLHERLPERTSMNEIAPALVEPPAPAPSPTEPSGSSPDAPFAEAFAALLAGVPVPVDPAPAATAPVAAGAESDPGILIATRPIGVPADPTSLPLRPPAPIAEGAATVPATAPFSSLPIGLDAAAAEGTGEGLGAAATPSAVARATRLADVLHAAASSPAAPAESAATPRPPSPAPPAVRRASRPPRLPPAGGRRTPDDARRAPGRRSPPSAPAAAVARPAPSASTRGRDRPPRAAPRRRARRHARPHQPHAA